MKDAAAPSEPLQDVRVWLEQDSSVHLKAVTPEGDPVELSPTEARKLSHILLELADSADR